MTRKENPLRRRIVLGSLLTGLSAALAGCSASGVPDDESGTDSDGEIIQRIDVDEVELVIELERDAVDQLNLIDPSGELFARRSIESGVSRTTIKIGVDYLPGEYELIGLAAGETVEMASIVLEPELELTELRLGRDYPEEMYDGASDSATRGEAILSVANQGSGPTAATTLRFEGDVPFPTDESYDEVNRSGIYDPESDFGADAESILIPAGEMVLIYSSSLPFSPASIRSKCDLVGQGGQFSVHLSATHESENLDRDYVIHYFGTSSDDCEIEIEETS